VLDVLRIIISQVKYIFNCEQPWTISWLLFIYICPLGSLFWDVCNDIPTWICLLCWRIVSMLHELIRWYL